MPIHLLRWHTTFKWHHKATKFKWYKKWSDYKFSHHVHVVTATFVLLAMLASTILSFYPKNNVLAATNMWSQSSFNGTSDGTYSNTSISNSKVVLGPSDGTGGTITHVNGKTIHSFTSGGTFVAPTGGVTASVLVVAAGGGGGAGQGGGGGGGAGGVVYQDARAISAGSYAVTVGTGGSRGTSAVHNGTNGGNSVFDTITANGGGGGRGDAGIGAAGGSCGGANGSTTNTCVPTQGNSGGGTGYGSAGGGSNYTSGAYGGGGGGGAGGAGTTGTTTYGGAGGVGISNSITGSAVYYGGGGGGGSNSVSYLAGAGGNGGGGAGGKAAVGTDGAANTGGGGGAGGSAYNNGGNGGSGVVIISYSAPYTTSGYYLSAPIAPAGLFGNWGTLNYDVTLNSQTLTIDVLNGADNSLISSNVASGTNLNLSTTTYPSLKLKANFSSNSSSQTPILNSWSVGYSYDTVQAPVGLTITPANDTSASVSWSVTSSATLGYLIERAPDSSGVPGTFVKAGGTCATVADTYVASKKVTSCDDSGLSANAKYYWRVRSIDLNNNLSSFSGEQTVDANTAGLWHLNETSGVVATDTSANNNKGYLKSAQYDAMNSTTGWSAYGQGSLSLNTTTYHEGTGAINMIKSGTTDTGMYLEKIYSPFDVNNKSVNVWVYIKDSTALSKINNFYIYLIGNGYAFTYRKDFFSSSLSTGWNLLSFDTANPDATGGTPNLAATYDLRIDLGTKNASDTLVAGDVVVDDWYYTNKSMITTGKFGNALTFTGSNSLDIGNFNPINSGNVTMEAWIKPSSISGQYIMAKGNDVTTSYSFGLQLSTSNNLQVMIGSSTGVYWVAATPSNSLTAGQWAYVAATISGSNVTTYINGVPAGSGTFTGTISGSATVPFWVGAQNRTGYTYGFLGQIDEVKVSNSARTASEIAAYYNYGTAKTLTAVPTVSVPITPQNSTKPTISGTGATANTTVRLYVDGSQNGATATADGSGNFTFNASSTGYVALSEGSHSFTVRGWNGTSETSDSNSRTVFVDTVAPTVPANLVTGTITNSAIALSWDAATENGSGLAGYEVQIAPDSSGVPGTWSEAGGTCSGLVATNSCNSTGLSSNIKYWFRVRAKDNAGNYGGYTGENTITLQPSAATGNDTCLSGLATETNYGAATVPNTFAGVNGSILISFDLSSIPSGSTIYSATLSLYETARSTTTTVSAYKMLRSWTEGTKSSLAATAGESDWVHYSHDTGSWSTLGGRGSGTDRAASASATDATFDATVGHFHSWSGANMVADVQSWINGGANNGWILYGDGAYSRLAMSDDATAANRPKLAITYGSNTFATTLTSTPVLPVQITPQNTTKPTVTGTGATPSTTVRLYDNGLLKASVLSDSSGNFTFDSSTVGYQDLTEGSHTNITVRGYNTVAETEDSVARTILVDIQNPVNGTLVGAWTSSEKNSQLADNDWSGNNNTSSVYFEWSGAVDEPILGTPSGIKRYHVYFGSNSSAIPKDDGTPTTANEAYATRSISSPSSGTDYYMRIQTEDNAGNYSTPQTLFTYKFDNTPPSGPTGVTVDPVAWSTENSFNFTWTNWTETASGLSYYLYNRKTSASSDTFEDFDLVNRKLTDVSNPINLNGLEALYTGVGYLRIYAVDKAGNVSSAYAAAPFFYSGTVAGPTIVPATSSNTQNSFGFTLTKPVGTTPVGYYCGTESSLDPTNSVYIDLSVLPETYTINGSTTNATISGDVVTLSEFAAAKQQGINYLYCATKDDMGNIGWSTKSTSDAFTVNTAAPSSPEGMRITDASDRGTSNWALTVGWSVIANPTPDFNSYEVWRCTASCDNIANFNDKRATISSNIYSESGLSNTTDYYYRIKSRDSVGHTSDFSESVHRIPTGKYTTPPTITSVPKADAKALSVNISWTTNRISNTIVQYGTSSVLGQEASKSTENVTDHSIEILGLAPGTTYHFKVQSLDADRDYDPSAALSEEYTFTTLAAPGISNVEVSEIRLSSAIITWKTTSSATSKISYGTSNVYGKSYTDSSSSQTTTHTVKLDSLSDSTTYHFKITGTDVDGNSLQSDDYVFTTLTFPKLSSLKIEQVPNTPTSTVQVKFTSNVPTSSLVTVNGKGGKDVAKYDLETDHVLKVIGLQDNTAYTISVKGRDQYGNEANAISESYKTAFDTRPPYITDITTETSIIGYGVDAKGQIVVSWTTDEPATSQVEFGSGVTGDYTSKTAEDNSLTENHVVIISDLKPSSPYHFRVVSKDNAGNSGISADNSVLTEQASESVIDLIIKSLQSSIGWIFNAFVRNQ